MYPNKITFLLTCSLACISNSFSSSQPEKQEAKVVTRKKRYIAKQALCISAFCAVILLGKYIVDLKKENSDLKLLTAHLFSADIQRLKAIDSKNKIKEEDAALFYARELNLQTLVHRLAWIKSAYQLTTKKTTSEIDQIEERIRKDAIIHLPSAGVWTQENIKLAVTHKLIRYYANEMKSMPETLELVDRTYLKGLSINQK